MTSFMQRLEARAREANSLLCIGLDPHPEDLPAPTPAAARDFCLRLIALTAGEAAAFKPNSAFFEALGAEGLAVLREVIAAVPEGIPVLLDAKRGDIASTARAYARAVFEVLGADAVTLNPYLGRETLEPFLQDPSHGAFLLCKTSNPGAADLQDLSVRDAGAGLSGNPAGGEQPLYEHVAGLARAWNERDNLGLVVGATQTEALARVRRAAPDLWILAPGVGAQGGDLEAALQAGLRQDRLGLLVPVSRGVARAEDPRGSAAGLREAINQVRGRLAAGAGARGEAPGPGIRPGDQALPPVASQLLETGCVKFGGFTLKSGLQSPIYLDLRRLASHPGLLANAAHAYRPLLERLAFDRLAALPYAALPIGTAISLQSGWPLIYPRKEVKSYGTRQPVEGEFEPGETAVVIDDLITTGGSKFEAIERLEAAGLLVRDVVVLIDRQSGGAEDLAGRGYQLHAVFTLTDLLDLWEAQGAVPEAQIEAVRAFITTDR